MTEVTQLLAAAVAGDPQAGSRLLPLVYDELRKLAAVRMANEKPGQTLDPTALVHEAYLRLVGAEGGTGNELDSAWANRGHFFAAAAEAMRRILVENARRKGRVKHGGGQRREQPDLDSIAAPEDDDLLSLHEALERFAAHDPTKAKLVELRFFAGLTLEQAADCLGMSLSSADRAWKYARAWLYKVMAGDSKKS